MPLLIRLVASLRDDLDRRSAAGRTLSDAEAVVADLVRQLSDYRYDFGGRTYRIGVNIGLRQFCPHECTGLDALRRADPLPRRRTAGAQCQSGVCFQIHPTC